MTKTLEATNLGALYAAVKKLEEAEARAAGTAQCPLCHAKTSFAIEQARAEVVRLARGPRESP